jgi:hypothetical protein
MDCLSDIFERTSPRKRGPQARSSRLAFLDEVTDQQLRSYTAAQLNRILTQRAQVRQVLIQSYFWVLADFQRSWKRPQRWILISSIDHMRHSSHKTSVNLAPGQITSLLLLLLHQDYIPALRRSPGSQNKNASSGAAMPVEST